MEEKYMNGIKAGVAGGIVLAIVAIIGHFLPLIGCLISPLTFIVWLAIGAVAIYIGPKAVTKLMDAAIIGAVAGVVAEIILLVVNLILGIISSLGSVEGFAITLVATLIGGVIGIVIAAVLAAVVAVVYTYVVLKITK
ncbi:hypothetical protein [Methanocella sp. MCL-LM]|uniref:hypothetical protein n=1 Tax=Methanocella sp. MCL-LM TaxID=3412035 RepID=UPI003C7897D9